ncbi:MAG: disulfide bond formation protein DsbA [Verrucomicrobiaceae bacterium]|nr:disulfide bond formation protein DsbA [Verrucomicrobiaceae bacterium]
MIRSVLALAALLLVPMAHAQAPVEPFKEGTNYFRIDEPVRPRDPKKIEVVEVFWYGCPHCFRFDPMVKAWQKKLPADVDFYRLPVIWNSVTELHARAFYTAQALGKLDQLHDPLFAALNEQGNPLNSQERVAQLFANYGVTAEQFDKAFNSFGVTSQVNQAKARTLSYRIEGTPELIVAGKFRVNGKALSSPNGTEQASHEKMLQAADFLIQQERKAQQNPVKK